MSTRKQQLANRRNALKSTGPRTAEGKSAMCLNALKHGLRSETPILPGEDPAEYEELVDQAKADLQPVGVMETILVQRAVSMIWRLQRLSRVELGLFTRQYYQQIIDQERIKADKDAVRLSVGGAIMYDNKALTEQRNQRILDSITDPATKAKIAEAQAQVESEVANLGAVFQRDAEGSNTFAKLSRYEVGVERSLYKTIEELHQLQARRRSRDAASGMSPVVTVETDPSAEPSPALPEHELPRLNAGSNGSDEMALFGKTERVAQTPRRKKAG